MIFSCTKCLLEKLRSDFYSSSSKIGVRFPCKSCIKKQAADWYRLNKERRAITCKEWETNNKEKVNLIARKAYAKNPQAGIDATTKWKQRNPERVREYKRKYRKEINPFVDAASELRRKTALRQARPLWANASIIGDIYRLAKIASAETGFKFEVDHMVPIRSKVVCGLHCQQNLTVILKSDNARKGNRYWPGQ